MDEPFNALDPHRRAIVRRELRAFHRERALTTLQVTHDFTEAGLLGDVAILLDAGRVLQSGPPAIVFRKPASPYVAEFLGAENVFAGMVHAAAGQAAVEVEEGPGAGQRLLEFRTEGLSFLAVGSAADGAAYAVIRSEEIIISLEAVAMSARNRFRGIVSEVAELGALTRVVIDVGTVPLIASLTTQSASEMKLARGREVYASFKAMAVHLC
jgi:molybdate/tungstate transport system ATP-binding protein